ncbi:hypothetical protein [Microbacterium sp. NPDC058345]|uniref:hypothetical protein n=1 Tax=Microbacterium sp. NPDC058345 TaxID=3346455 RepID=UPI00366840A9
MEQEQQSPGISRRTFTRAAAWSVPVVAAATAVPFAAASVTPPVEGLWYSVTPGGEGNPAGTAGFTIFNNGDADFDGTVSIRIALWPYPFSSLQPIVVNGSVYRGQRALENRRILGRYLGVPVTVPAGSQLDFLFDYTDTTETTQGTSELISIVADDGTPMVLAGEPTFYTPYTPAP